MQDSMTAMPEPIVLVLSRDDSLVGEIKGQTGRTRAVQFEIRANTDQACALMQRGAVALVLADGNLPVEPDARARLLAAGNAAVVVTRGRSGSTPERAGRPQ